jgi:aryl-alcohol dehydrogenase-like predicted oxidoreductase
MHRCRRRRIVAADTDSERLIGDAIRSARARDRIVVATRVPVLAERPGAPDRDALPERLPAAYVQHRVEASLRATRLDALPLVQLALRPGWTASSAWPELVGRCAQLIRDGKVLAWGALIDEPADDALPGLLAEPWLAALSVGYSLCDRRAEPLFELLRAAPPREPVIPAAAPPLPGAPPATPAAAPPRPTILARAPLAGGALAGNLGPGVRLRPRDDRNAIEPAILERIAIGVARLVAEVKREPPAVRASEVARAIAERGVRPAHVECGDLAELALRFAIDRAGIALPRLHRRDHLLAGIAAAAAPPLSAALIARITAPAS